MFSLPWILKDACLTEEIVKVPAKTNEGRTDNWEIAVNHWIFSSSIERVLPPMLQFFFNDPRPAKRIAIQGLADIALILFIYIMFLQCVLRNSSQFSFWQHGVLTFFARCFNKILWIYLYINDKSIFVIRYVYRRH